MQHRVDVIVLKVTRDRGRTVNDLPSDGEWLIGRLAIEVVIVGSGVVLQADGDDVKVVVTEKEDALAEVAHGGVEIADVVDVCGVVVIHTSCGIYRYCNGNVTVMIIILVCNTTRRQTHNALRLCHVTCLTKKY